MNQQAELLNKIDKIPQKYIGEVINFLGYVQHKAQQEANNTKLEQKTCECIIPHSIDDDNGKILLTKELIDEMLQKSPHTRSLSGILSGMGDVDLDKLRMERLAKHL